MPFAVRCKSFASSYLSPSPFLHPIRSSRSCVLNNEFSSLIIRRFFFFFLKMLQPVMLESVVFQDVVERLYPCVILMSLLFFPSLNFGCQIPPPCRVNPCPNSPHKLGGPVMHFRLNFQSTSVPKQSHLKRVLGESNATVCVTFYAVMRDTNRWDCGPINVRKPFCAVKVL